MLLNPGLPEAATWIGALGALSTAAIAIVLASQLRNRERRQALVDLHTSLTSGETANARNAIGTLLYSKKHRRHVDELEAIDAYFRLIWAIQRARNVFRVHGFHWTSLDGPERKNWAQQKRKVEIESALSWNLQEIADNVVEFHLKYCKKWNVEDHDAWDEMSVFLS